MTDKLFVYGTLKRGYPLHHWIGGAEFIGPAKTVRHMAMYASAVPYVTEREQVSPIHGELFTVDAATLSNADRLEGHPLTYTRKETEVRTEDGDTHTAWLYFWEHDLIYPKLRKDGVF
jgi:gamma-glutamylcyclotransferase (GGCT)/AIG2-like uncharacterized protein YtfP